MLSERVKKLRDKGDNESQVVETLVNIMKEMGWTLEQLKNIPIPTYQVILEVLQKQDKEMKQRMKKK